MSVAGYLPEDLGLIDLSPTEMMFWMYLPISLPGSRTYHLPDNLRQFAEIVSAVKEHEPERFMASYAYITAKTLWVGGAYIGNRPGWHIDGYGTEDVNYIWADRAPTEFIGTGGPCWNLSDDCDESLAEMERIARSALCLYDIPIRTYPDKHLLRLDNTIIHRSPVEFAPGMRSFVKVSLSTDEYNLLGNSRNHLLPDTHWPLVDRQIIRNHPATRNADHG